ncbi:hypothetical protein [Absidia glauca]|uniref:Uncharacterized protein n=1 Tax=Absidia glauca TaxID=4829 RepID=A0A163LUY9_ABSGL|nr:hypothetical protein [Absidia glauca]
MDGLQFVQAKYKDADRLRHTAAAATELFEDITIILEQVQQPENLAHQLATIQEKCRLLVRFGYSSGKLMDQEARDVTTMDLRLPPSLKRLEDEPDEDKDLVFSADEIQQINKARYEHQAVRQQ